MRAPAASASITAQAPVQPSIQAPMPVPRPANIAGPTKLAALKQPSSPRERSREPIHEASHEPIHEPIHGSNSEGEYATAFLENLTSSVDSGNLFAQRQLTASDMMDYANRNYRNARTAELLPNGSEYR
jgi:hypothetical protein